MRFESEAERPIVPWEEVRLCGPVVVRAALGKEDGGAAAACSPVVPLMAEAKDSCGEERGTDATEAVGAGTVGAVMVGGTGSARGAAEAAVKAEAKAAFSSPA